MSNLRDLRKAAHLTQQQLAESCNVSQSAVSRWETDGKAPCKYRRFIRAALGCTEEELKEIVKIREE